MGKPLDDGWDKYCVEQFKAYLLREAARAVELAATKKMPGDSVVAHSMLASRCIDRASGRGKAPAQLAEEAEESSVRRFIRKALATSNEETSAMIDKIKFAAKRLRGQLDLFDETKPCDE
jgi:methionine-rich copper-binding protein CopC